METITITVKRFEELLKKEVIYDLNRTALLQDIFLCDGKILFDAVKPAKPTADDDF